MLLVEIKKQGFNPNHPLGIIPSTYENLSQDNTEQVIHIDLGYFIIAPIDPKTKCPS